jgi:nucleotide-binding universal stress UspA family protein
MSEEKLTKIILAPIDGSAPSFRALERAATLAHALQANLTVMVVRQYIVGRHATAAMLSEAEVAGVLTKAREIAAAKGCPGPTIVVKKARDVAHAIVAFAEKANADQIVIGASGTSGIKLFLLGSVSSEVIKEAACPVTVVH